MNECEDEGVSATMIKMAKEVNEVEREGEDRERI